jgi:hypothetical protein
MDTEAKNNPIVDMVFQKLEHQEYNRVIWLRSHIGPFAYEFEIDEKNRIRIKRKWR